MFQKGEDLSKRLICLLPILFLHIHIIQVSIVTFYYVTLLIMIVYLAWIETGRSAMSYMDGRDSSWIEVTKTRT
jgi:hypothetical protein